MVIFGFWLRSSTVKQNNRNLKFPFFVRSQVCQKKGTTLENTVGLVTLISYQNVVLNIFCTNNCIWILQKQWYFHLILSWNRTFKCNHFISMLIIVVFHLPIGSDGLSWFTSDRLLGSVHLFNANGMPFWIT